MASAGQQKILSESPLNSEPPARRLVESFVSPRDAVYRRNHGQVLSIDPEQWTLSLEADDGGLSLETKEMRLQDVKSFEPCNLTGVLVCAGNRRLDMESRKQVEGIKWHNGAVANVKWTGALLRDVLLQWGISEDANQYDGLHVHFEANQKCEEDDYYGASIPLALAMSQATPALLAYEMNDQPLTAEHGAPVRVYIPGIIGARSVKWVQRILIKREESNCFYQQRDYKILPPEATPETKEEYMTRTSPMMTFDANSAICVPERDETVTVASDGTIDVSGYAYGSEGIPIARVSVACLPLPAQEDTRVQMIHDRASKLGPDQWTIARLDHGPGQRPPRETGASGPDELASVRQDDEKDFAWTLWSARVPVPRPDKADQETTAQSRRQVALVAFCEDVRGQRQPVESPYNVRGVNEASWPVVKVYLVE